MASTDYGDNTLNVTGGNNQFVVVYKFSGTEDPNAGASGPPAGLPFGAATALNNTDPNYDFSTLDQGQVITVDGGATNMTIDGGNKQFVVQYNLPGSPDPSANLGGNSVSVGGGNNKFVVAYEYPAGDAQSGNSVSVDGGSNQYVVDYKYMLPAGSDAPAASGDQSVQFAGSSGTDANGNSGVTAGSEGGNSVTVNGDNNLYAVQYGDPSGATSDPASGSPFGAGGNPFAGSIPSGGSMSGSTTDGSTTDGSMTDGSGAGGAMPAGVSNDALTALIAQSPFGVLLGLPGINSAADIFGNVGSSGANPFAGASAGGNPFAGLAPGGGSSGDASTVPAAAPAASDPNYTYDLGASGDGAPGGSADGMQAAAPPSSDPNYAYDFSGTQAAGGALTTDGGAPAASGDSSNGNSGSVPFDASMLAASPFGALLQIPGFSTTDIANIFAGSNNGGGNPFAIAGNASGSPFDLGAAITSMVDSLAAAPPSTSTTSVLTAIQSAAGVIADDTSVPGFVSSFASNLDNQVTQIISSQGS